MTIEIQRILVLVFVVEQIFSNRKRIIVLGKKKRKNSSNVNVIENNYILILFSFMKQFSFLEKKL